MIKKALKFLEKKRLRCKPCYTDLLNDLAPKSYYALMQIGDAKMDIMSATVDIGKSPASENSAKNSLNIGKSATRLFIKIILWCFKKDWKWAKKQAKFECKGKYILREQSPEKVETPPQELSKEIAVVAESTPAPDNSS